MTLPAMVRFLSGVLRRGLRRASSQAPREGMVTAALRSLLTVLMRVPLTWAFRTAGSAMMDEALAEAMCEATA